MLLLSRILPNPERYLPGLCLNCGSATNLTECDVGDIGYCNGIAAERGEDVNECALATIPASGISMDSLSEVGD